MSAGPEDLFLTRLIGTYGSEPTSWTAGPAPSCLGLGSEPAHLPELLSVPFRAETTEKIDPTPTPTQDVKLKLKTSAGQGQEPTPATPLLHLWWGWDRGRAVFQEKSPHPPRPGEWAIPRPSCPFRGCVHNQTLMGITAPLLFLSPFHRIGK